MEQFSLLKAKATELQLELAKQRRKRIFDFERAKMFQIQTTLNFNVIQPADLVFLYQQMNITDMSSIIRLRDALFVSDLRREELEELALTSGVLTQLSNFPFATLGFEGALIVILELLVFHSYHSSALTEQLFTGHFHVRLAQIMTHSGFAFRVYDLVIILFGNAISDIGDMRPPMNTFQITGLLNSMSTHQFSESERSTFVNRCLWILKSVTSQNIKTDCSNITQLLLTEFQFRQENRKAVLKALAKTVPHSSNYDAALLEWVALSSASANPSTSSYSQYNNETLKMTKARFLLLIELISQGWTYNHTQIIHFMNAFSIHEEFAFLTLKLGCLLLERTSNEHCIRHIISSQFLSNLSDLLPSSNRNPDIANIIFQTLNLISQKINDETFNKHFFFGIIGLRGLLNIWDTKFEAATTESKLKFINFTGNMLLFTMADQSHWRTDHFDEILSRMATLQLDSDPKVYKCAYKALKKVLKERDRRSNKNRVFFDKTEADFD